jgi:hypothetical protein
MGYIKIPPKYELRPILEALLDELSRGIAGGAPTVDPTKVDRIIESGNPDQRAR